MTPPVEEQRTQEMASVGDTAEVPSPPPPPPEPVAPPPQLYQTATPTGPRARTGGSQGFVTSSPYVVYRALYWTIQLGVPVLFTLFAAVTALIPLAFWGMATLHPRFAHFQAQRIGALLVSAIRCPGCGFEMDAVSRWSVGFYNDHKERHFYLAKNPIDKSFIGHTDCPQCEATIRIR